MRGRMIRWAVRVVVLAAALFLALGGPVPAELKRLFPALSPLVAVSSAIAQRSWYLGLFWGVPPLVFLALGFWRGRVLQVGFRANRSAVQFFEPELDPEQGFCLEFCNECTKVCPAGAISALTVDEKRMWQIGTATVKRSACLA